MSSATLTLIGLNNFLDYQEKNLFENFILPSSIDGETAINNILMVCGDKELLYPDAEFMIEAIGMWCTKWQRTFTKWSEALVIEYNPLENYDRNEEFTDSLSSSESTEASASDSSYHSMSQVSDVSAFNTDDYLRPDTSATDKVQNNATSSSKVNALKDEYNKRTGRIHGNIGVTTSQQMLQAELDIDRFNIYDEIAFIFMREFCLAL